MGEDAEMLMKRADNGSSEEREGGPTKCTISPAGRVNRPLYNTDNRIRKVSVREKAGL